MAATLLTRLPPEKFAALGGHEQLAITELGTYVEEAMDYLEATPEATDGDPVDQAARIHSEADAYLRATLGFARFNQLSFQASGLSSRPDDTPRPQRF